MSTFEAFITQEATTALRHVAATREVVKRPDATAEDGAAFYVACRAADAGLTIMEETGYEDLYYALRDEIDAED